MSRTSVRRHSRKFAQNVKKSKAEKVVVSSRREISQSTKQVLRVQTINNKHSSSLPKISKHCTHSESKIESSMPQPERKSRSHRLSTRETSSNFSNESRRITRSSFGSDSISRVTSSSLLRNRSSKLKLDTQPAVKLVNTKPTYKEKELVKIANAAKVTRSKSVTGSTSPLLRFSKRHVKQKPIVEKKKSGVATEVSKRVTRSSIGSVTSSTLIRNKNSSTNSTLLPASKKQTVKHKAPVVNTEVSKRMMRSSFGNVSSTANQDKTKSTEQVKDSNIVDEDFKRMAHSHLGNDTGCSPFVEMTHESKLVGSSLPQYENLRSKKTKNSDTSMNTTKEVQSKKIKSALDALILSTRKKSESSHSGSSGSYSYKNEQTCLSNKGRKIVKTLKSVKSRYTGLKNIPIDCLANIPFQSSVKNISSSVVAPVNLGERLNATKVHKKSSRSSKVAKGVKAKGSPQVEGKRKRKASFAIVVHEDPVTMDRLTPKFSNKRLRRHTVDVQLNSERSKSASTTQKQSRKKSSLNTQKKSKSAGRTPKSGHASRTDSSSCATPDISLLPVDSLTTFVAKRCKSAPAAINKSLKTAIPKKGTLKRKRWMLSALKEKNEGYEDDIFENKKFATPNFRMPLEHDDESDSSIATPKFGFLLTPAIPKKTPKYKEIISPSELFKARKCAEEYLFRRNRKRSNNTLTLDSPAAARTSVSTNYIQVPEKKKLEFSEAMNNIETIQKHLEQKTQDEVEEEDSYFSDVSCT